MGATPALDAPVQQRKNAMDHPPPYVQMEHASHAIAVSAEAQDEMPACQSCRKRKLKCSRQLPSCSQCARLSCLCIYDEKKQKPGLRSGMVEHLNRRLEAVENALHEQKRRRPRSPPVQGRDDAQGCAYHAALLIANEILRDGPRGCADTSQRSAEYSQSGDSERLLSGGSRPSLSDGSRTLIGKRKRSTQGLLETLAVDVSAEGSLPASDVLDATVDYYFSKIHFWIPLIHEGRFRARMAEPDEQPRLVVLLHAMVAIALKHVESAKPEIVGEQIRRSKNIVMLNAMESLTVENLQALALLAFDHTGSGNFPSAWSIVGSLTKSVDYLQLAIEPDEQPRQALLDPPKLLPDAAGPVEIEERRRVFWNVILLDRFCSATSGWTSSLNSYNVRRRLPSNGGMWALGEYAVTPFLGILDKSTAKVGNLMAYVAEPAAASPPEPNGEINSPASSSAHGSTRTVDTSHVGAFAFRIEAAESLNQVISFFLQQEIDFRNREEVSRWLARFKELDLRLVQWKLFFPQRWSNSKVSKEQPRHNMDPNLTLAHLTHNVSTILLHQHIATPPPAVRAHVQLPSSCSAETCALAAGEIASITAHYLGLDEGPVPSQFAFCAFIAARTLLTRWRFDTTATNEPLSPDFERLVANLHEMSRRWHGLRPATPASPSAAPSPNDIAARYAHELRALHATCITDPHFRTELLNYPYLALSLRSPATQDAGLAPDAANERSAPGENEEYEDDDAADEEDDGDDEEAYYAPPPNGTQGSQPLPQPQAPTGPLRTGITPLAGTPRATGMTPHAANVTREDPYAGRSQHMPHEVPSTPHGNGRYMMPPTPSAQNGSGRHMAHQMPTPSGMNGSGLPYHLTDDPPGDDPLAAMSQGFWDAAFLEMDRVFTLDGTDFQFE